MPVDNIILLPKVMLKLIVVAYSCNLSIGRLRQKDSHVFKASLGCGVRPCLGQTKIDGDRGT